jgi:hypothetical protein
VFVDESENMFIYFSVAASKDALPAGVPLGPLRITLPALQSRSTPSYWGSGKLSVAYDWKTAKVSLTGMQRCYWTTARVSGRPAGTTAVRPTPPKKSNTSQSRKSTR